MREDAVATGSAIADVAAAVADPTRAAMLTVLMDGRAWTVGELGRAVGTAPSSATEHAHLLVATGWCDEVRQGRHRYLRLASTERAALIEALGVLRPSGASSPTSLGGVRASRELAAGRTCYRHLAGRLGVAIADEWRARGWIVGDVLTDVGRCSFEALAIATEPAGRRPLVRPCLDWTERRDHVAGLLPDRFCAALLERGWLLRRGSGRAVSLTPAGRAGLAAAGLTVVRDLPAA